MMNRSPPEYQDDVVVENKSEKKEMQKESKKEESHTDIKMTQKKETKQGWTNISRKLLN